MFRDTLEIRATLELGDIACLNVHDARLTASLKIGRSSLKCGPPFPVNASRVLYGLFVHLYNYVSEYCIEGFAFLRGRLRESRTAGSRIYKAILYPLNNLMFTIFTYLRTTGLEVALW